MGMGRKNLSLRASVRPTEGRIEVLLTCVGFIDRSMEPHGGERKSERAPAAVNSPTPTL
jgi:hypothetical protein